MHIDLIQFITVTGYIGVTAIIFAESGILLGFFLPGDSLLFTAGLLAATGLFNIWWLVILTFVAAVLGDSVGYYFGVKFGPKVFKRENGRIFHKDNLAKAQSFYDQHGPITIVLARFTPIIRTFAPILAGVGKMNYSLFLTYNLVGGALWALTMNLLGFFLGRTIPNIDRYILPIIAVIILVSLLPSLKHLLKRD